MLPIYEAIDIIGIISQKVGHTQPWVIIANTPDGLRPFVTKLYTTPQIELNNSITNEVVCNILAPQFDLKVPKCALIDIPDSLVFTKPPEFQFQFSNSDPRLKFATELLLNINAAIPNLPKSSYTKRVSIDSLYAFDNMIRNADRGQQKSNLLLSPKEAFLIDHELTLNRNNIAGIDLGNFNLEDRFTKHHLLYSYLKNAWRSKKIDYFYEFQENLRTLNINTLNNYYLQLSNNGYTTHSHLINHWLNQLKQNSSIFVDSLRGSIS